MKLLAYTIGGQVIGVDILSWDEVTLSGNTAFMAIADTGSTPVNYTNISSVNTWDNYGSPAGLSAIEIKNEIIKLIPNTPTQAQYDVLAKYMDVGINSMTKIGTTAMLGSTLTISTALTGVTDTKFSVTGGTINGDIKSTGAICGVNGTLDVGGNLNVGGNQTMGGNLTMSGNLIIAGTGVVTSASNLGTGVGVYGSLSGKNLQFKSLKEGSNVALSSDANSITISAGGGTGTTITTLFTSATGNITTTSTTDVLMTGMQIANVPAGRYLLSFGTSLSVSTTATVNTSIYAGGTIVANSTLPFARGSQAVTAQHAYSNFVITLASTQTVEIRWRTSTGTATANTNRYLTLLKVL